jgi:hypothetical protein
MKINNKIAYLKGVGGIVKRTLTVLIGVLVTGATFS